ASLSLPSLQPKTKHMIFIVNCGARKRDYYEDVSLSPRIHELARESFVFEQDHCERVASHRTAFMELLRGRESTPDSRYPTLLDYIGDGFQLDSILAIPSVLDRHGPRIVVCREPVHDVGHHSYEEYLRAIRSTDEAVGRLVDWVKMHPHFSANTAIVI